MALPRTEMAALRGVPASPGIGVGAVRRLAAPVSAGTVVPEDRRGAEIERALDALAAAAGQLDALAARLRADGRDSDAEIVETGALMALDPGLAADVRAAVGRRPAGAGRDPRGVLRRRPTCSPRWRTRCSPRAPTTCAAWDAGRRC